MAGTRMLCIVLRMETREYIRAKGGRAFYCSIQYYILLFGGERGLLCAAYKASFFTSTTTSYGIAALCGAYLNHACLLALVSAGKNFLSSSKVLLRRSCFHYSTLAAALLLLLLQWDRIFP